MNINLNHTNKNLLILYLQILIFHLMCHSCRKLWVLGGNFDLPLNMNKRKIVHEFVKHSESYSRNFTNEKDKNLEILLSLNFIFSYLIKKVQVGLKKN